MIVCALAVVPFSTAAQVDDPDVFRHDNGRPDCVAGTTLAMSTCFAEQARKADRWLQSVFISYVRQTEAKVAEMKRAFGELPPDVNPVGHLKQSQELFERYRKEMVLFVYEENYYGSLRVMSAPLIELKLTIDRVTHLLELCNFRAGVPAVIDLKKTNWCEDLQ